MIIRTIDEWISALKRSREHLGGDALYAGNLYCDKDIRDEIECYFEGDEDADKEKSTLEKVPGRQLLEMFSRAYDYGETEAYVGACHDLAWEAIHPDPDENTAGE